MLNWPVAVICIASIALSIGCSTTYAQNDSQPAVSVYTMSIGRVAGSAGVLAGLVGVIIGGLALRSPWRRGAIIALVAGMIGIALGGWVVAAAPGGVGTGNGLGGGIVALVVGPISMALGGLALARSRRSGDQSNPKQDVASAEEH